MDVIKGYTPQPLVTEGGEKFTRYETFWDTFYMLLWSHPAKTKNFQWKKYSMDILVFSG
jgi:hypothetical protein